MNKLIHGLIVIGLCAAFVLPARAQTVISAADVAAQLTFGNTSVQRTDTSRSPLNIGAPGATSWNFSTLGSHDTTLLMSVFPDTTPFAANYPGANHAFRAPIVTEYSGLPVTGIGYQYLKLDSTMLLNPGNMGVGNVLGIPGTLQTTNNPVDTTYILPLTLGTRWGSTYTSTQVVMLGGTPVSNTVVQHNLHYVVDAYGPMTMPGGTVHAALRIKRTDSTASGKSLRYTFLAKDGATVEFGVDPASPDSGTLAVGTVTWTNPSTGPTSVELRDNEIPAKFALMQNWPNPFNPSTTIAYAVGGVRGQESGVSQVRLSVYDILGREVAVLVNEAQAPGNYQVTFNAAGLASGVYYYRLQSGAFSQTQKMVLMK